MISNAGGIVAMWDKALKHSARIWNRVCHKLGFVTPLGRIGVQSADDDLKCFRVFGCDCIYKRTSNDTKFHERGRNGIYVGTVDGPLYEVFCMETRVYVQSDIAVFFEERFHHVRMLLGVNAVPQDPNVFLGDQLAVMGANQQINAFLDAPSSTGVIIPENFGQNTGMPVVQNRSVPSSLLVNTSAPQRQNKKNSEVLTTALGSQPEAPVVPPAVQRGRTKASVFAGMRGRQPSRLLDFMYQQGAPVRVAAAEPAASAGGGFASAGGVTAPATRSTGSALARPTGYDLSLPGNVAFDPVLENCSMAVEDYLGSYADDGVSSSLDVIATGGDAFVCDIEDYFSPDANVTAAEHCYRADAGMDRILGGDTNPAMRTPRHMKEALEIDDACGEPLWAEPASSEVTKMFSYGVWVVLTLAMVAAMKANGTWMPPTKPVWDFKIKRAIDGSVDKRRARCCLGGHMLKEGIHYDKTFSPVCSQRAIRGMWHIAVMVGCVPFLFDVEVAFLNAAMDRILLIYPPAGYETYHEDGSLQVYRVDKAMYGAPQAPRCWYVHFHDLLAKAEFKRCTTDPCVWIWGSLSGQFYMVGIHVDDVMRVTNLPAEKADKWFVSGVCKSLKLSELGRADMHCGIQAKFLPNGDVLLHQERYARDVCTRFGFTGCKPVKVPIRPEVKYVKDDPSDVVLSEADASLFRQKMGAVAFGSSNCWIRLVFAMLALGQYLHKPTEKAMAGVNHVLQWLAHNALNGMYLKCPRAKDLQKLNPLMYVDGAYMNLQLGRSTLAYSLHTVVGLLFAKCGKTDVVASSSTEVELIALVFGMKAAMWYRNWFAELGVVFDVPSTVKEDNQASIFIWEDVSISDRTKHIQMKIWFAREKLNKGIFQLEHCPTELMWADVMTKAHHEREFKNLFHLLTGQAL